MKIVLACSVLLLSGASQPTAAADAGAGQSDALEQAYQSARCLVQRRPKQTAEMLSIIPESMDFFTAYLKADTPDSGCFPGKPSSGPKPHFNSIRGGIAEAMLKRDFLAMGIPRVTRLAPVFRSAPHPTPEPLRGAQKLALAYLRLTECVVQTQPREAFAVFNTIVASKEERSAVRALLPVLNGCVDEGATVALNPSIIRSFLAEAAYRVSVAWIDAAKQGSARPGAPVGEQP